MDEIRSGSPSKDGIPAIGDPEFITVAKAQTLTDTMPVIGLVVNGETKAYPLDILMRHETVNDTIAGVPMTSHFARFVMRRSFSTVALTVRCSTSARRADCATQIS
jgi:hypothetical protein